MHRVLQVNHLYQVKLAKPQQKMALKMCIDFLAENLAGNHKF